MDDGNGGSNGQQQWRLQWTMKTSFDNGGTQWAFVVALARQQYLMAALDGGGGGRGCGSGNGQQYWWTMATAVAMDNCNGSSGGQWRWR
jgi:hypothetical protein